MNVNESYWYAKGYVDGEDSVAADFDFWFHDTVGMPDDWDMERCKAWVVGAWAEWDWGRVDA